MATSGPTTTPTTEYRECFKCWYRAVVAAEQCPRCGRPLYTSANIRTRGVLGIVVGIFLAGFMGAIAVGVAILLAGAAKNPDSARQMNTEAGMLIAIYGLFAVVIAFGLHSILTGTFHLITGRRSRALIWIMWALLIVIFAAAGMLRVFL